MKKMKILSILILALVVAALPVRAQDPVEEELRAKLAEIDVRIARTTLELNHLTVECYIDQAERSLVTPPVMNYPGLRYRALCDTVPALKELEARYLAATEIYTEILKSDPRYESVHREYIAINGLNDQKRKDANKEQYNLLYARLRKNNPDYVPALEARQEAMRLRSMGVLRFLFEYYRTQGIAIPVEPLFKSSYSGMRALRAAYPAIDAKERELRLLNSLRGEVQEQLMRKKLGIPKTEGNPAPEIVTVG